MNREQQLRKHSLLILFRMILAACLIAVMPMVVAASNPLVLHESVQRDDTSALEAAIKEGASLNEQDSDGWNALMYAAKGGNVDALSMLLKAGALPDISDRLGRTPLHLASAAPAEISSSLIQAGTDVNSRNAGGVTALMLAAGGGRRDIVELLLAAGARMDLKDYQGSSVVEWSRRSSDQSFTKELKQKLDLVGNEAPTVPDEEFAEDVFVDVQFPSWFKESFLDLQEDLDEAINAGKEGLMIFVSTRRCSYCKEFIQNSLGQADIRRRLLASFDVVGLEIFDDSEMTDPTGHSHRVKEYVSINNAAYTPTLIFYGQQGKVVLKIVGYYPPEKFRSVLDYLDGQHYLRESLRSFVSRQTASSSTPVKGIISDGEIFSSPPYILDRRAAAAQQPLLVVFEQPGCDSCKHFHEHVLGDKSISRLMKEYEAVQLDTSDTKSRLITPQGEAVTPAQWLEQLELAYSPSIIFFDESGEEVMRLDSETRRFRMEGSLQLVLEKGYLKGAQLQRWRRDKAVQLFNLEQGSPSVNE